MNIAIITARGGSKSIPDKNVMDVGGKPLVSYPIEAAQQASLVGAVFVSTDCPKIRDVADACGVDGICPRPRELCGDDVNHGDVIQHAVRSIAGMIGGVDNVVVLLGNTVMVDGELIDEALAILDAEPRTTGAMSVWQAGDDHPCRAMHIDEHGGLFSRTYGQSTNRQSYQPTYYYDQGVWAFRAECVERRDGPSPWWWMGSRCKPIVRPWVTGRDIHGALDVDISEWWLSRQREVAHAH